MAAQPKMVETVGLLFEGLKKSLRFYRRLGLDIFEGAEEKPHFDIRTRVVS